MAKRYLMCCHALAREFQRRTEDRLVERCFPTRLPSECRSERDASVGVLVCWNGGCWKISPKKVAGSKVFRGGCGFCEAS